MSISTTSSPCATSSTPKRRDSDTPSDAPSLDECPPSGGLASLSCAKHRVTLQTTLGRRTNMRKGYSCLTLILLFATLVFLISPVAAARDGAAGGVFFDPAGGLSDGGVLPMTRLVLGSGFTVAHLDILFGISTASIPNPGVRFLPYWVLNFPLKFSSLAVLTPYIGVSPVRHLLTGPSSSAPASRLGALASLRKRGFSFHWPRSPPSRSASAWTLTQWGRSSATLVLTNRSTKSALTKPADTSHPEVVRPKEVRICKGFLRFREQ